METGMNVSDAVERRISVRAFKPDPVPGALVAVGAPVGGAGGRGTWAVVAATGAEAGRAAVGAAVAGAAAGVAPVGGSEGSLIVGAAVGFGGSAIRTVSFLGCTLAASGGFGGTGESGVGSAINLSVTGN